MGLWNDFVRQLPDHPEHDRWIAMHQDFMKKIDEHLMKLAPGANTYTQSGEGYSEGFENGETPEEGQYTENYEGYGEEGYSEEGYDPESVCF